MGNTSRRQTSRPTLPAHERRTQQRIILTSLAYGIFCATSAFLRGISTNPFVLAGIAYTRLLTGIIITLLPSHERKSFLTLLLITLAISLAYSMPFGIQAMLGIGIFSIPLSILLWLITRNA